MEKFLQELDSIIDLSNKETEKIAEAFKQFIDRNFHVDAAALNKVFSPEQPPVVFNQQEDEDNLHAHYGEFIYSQAS
ncbi:MAG: hypothetical protein K2X48_07750 [Chitinophagaceae bacterium]|nr:hypothetical protein [Chitinophagaceae bacterium]